MLNKANWAKCGMLGYSLVYGAIYWLAFNGVLPNYVKTLAIAGFGLVTLLWMFIDSNEKGAKSSAAVYAVTAILPIVGAPTYLLQNKRSLPKFFGFLAFMFVAYMVGTFVPNIMGWL